MKKVDEAKDVIDLCRQIIFEEQAETEHGVTPGDIQDGTTSVENGVMSGNLE